MNNTENLIFKTNDETISFEVNINNNTVWLNRNQMAELFDRDVSTISRHIKKAISEELNGLDEIMMPMPCITPTGKSFNVEYYNLDVVLSVGYRVRSKRGIEFRRWANNVLRSHILKKNSQVNEYINQIGDVLAIMKRADNMLESRQILDVIENFTLALDMLDDYDHQTLGKPEGSEASYVLTYEECREVIDKMKFNDQSELFGNEKDDSFRSSIAAIYQTFAGYDVYPSLEEKAANLLYLVTKNHSFSDGNKRIAATMFLYFLEKNNMLYVNDEKIINDYTLVAITIMIAESKPEEKDTMVKLVMNFLTPANR
ncbi:MAG: virulence protein RhuM/Fic/DOC family protein [Lachnospiraceae bacterium]|nr:virulence protein RhuM/Fic/DOC family protein [Lachnospiraceae bacterium]